MTSARLRIARHLACALLAALTTLYAVGCTPTPPPAPPPAPYSFALAERFQIAGTGTASINGLAVAGRFRLELVKDGDRVTVRHFVTEIRDFDIVRHFLFIETARERFRCTQAVDTAPMSGTVDAAGSLRLDPGARMHLVTYDSRAAEGACPGTGRIFRAEGTSDRQVTGVHDPTGNQFRLHGTFHTAYDGDGLDMTLDLAGTYVNRPPMARIGVEGPGYDLAQGGCPPLVGTNPPTAEANSPDGLRLTLISNSYDRDGSIRTDLATEGWSHWLGVPSDPASPYRFLGRGRVVGPVLFDFSTSEHFLRLDVTDRHRVGGRSGCRFRVADTTPPSITVPRMTRVPCTDASGASPAASRELAGFLAGSSATDLVDATPERLPSRLGSVEITESTLFAPGRRAVTFRYQDSSGNVGTQDALVEVGVDGVCG
jgi:hypothetical protein